MLVRLVVKATNFELHGESLSRRASSGQIPGEVLRKLETSHQQHYDVLGKLKAALEKAGVSYDEVRRDDALREGRSYDAVLTVGGDGTLLAASHAMVEGGLILGFKSSASSIGYLCGAELGQEQDAVDALTSKVPPTVTVHRLCARIRRCEPQNVERTAPILNDFLYTNANPAATTRYKLAFGDDAEIQRSSGIWIATGAGSTAAIHAAGGEKRPMDDTRFQFRVRELYPLGPENPSIDGGFFEPETTTFRIENRSPDAMLALDGQHGAVALDYGDQLAFERAAPLQLVRLRR